MAKVKKNAEVNTENGVGENTEIEPSVDERIQKEIQKNFGKNIIISGNDIVEKKKHVIPISPRLDSITGGGIPEGSWVIFSGKPKGGKSLSALHFAATAQKPEHGERTVYYLNVEARIKRRDILGIAHLQQDKFKIIQSTKDTVLSAKDFLTIASNILKTEEKCVLIIDSLSALCDERELNDGIGTQLRGSDKILIRQFMSQMQSVVPNRDHIVISILQMMANTSGFGSPTFERGGSAVQFQSDIKLKLDKFAPWTPVDGKPPIGQIVDWNCSWSALGSPGRKAQGYIRYGLGIDEPYEIIEDAKELGLITTVSKSSFVCEFMKNHLDVLGVTEWSDKGLKDVKVKFTGAEKLRNALVHDRPEWFQLLRKDMEEYV